MPGCFLSVRQVCALAILFAILGSGAGAQGDGVMPQPHPFGSAETLQYSIEWRLIAAGTAELKIELSHDANRPEWQIHAHVESAGLVSKLYKLDDNYTSHVGDQFCVSTSEMDAFEGKKHHDARVSYDYVRNRAVFLERDLVKNTTMSTKEIQLPGCVSDVLGGLYKMRTLRLQPGQSAQIPTSDGKKWAPVRIEAQEREEIKNHVGDFKTIRYEAFLFNGVIYSKKASMLVWVTDDDRHLPVQIRARMGFPIGSITLSLEKEEHQ